MRLFEQFILRHLAQDRPRSCASVLGIALGIAVVVAIQLANAGSYLGFQAAVESIAGKTSLEIVGQAGRLDEMTLLRLNWLRSFGQLSPVIEGDGQVNVPGSAPDTIRILGVDILHDRPFREYRILEFSARHREPTSRELLDLLLDSRSIILTEVFAARHRLQVGSSLEVTIGDRVRTFVVRGLLMNEGPARALDGNFALMDIAAAQLAFDRMRLLDRIDVRLEPGVRVDDAEKSIAERLPAGLAVQRPEQRGREVEKMLAAFHFNLAALSHVSLLVGLFLIYNTVSISVITRREEIGMLRALGCTRNQILALFLAEAGTLAIAGCTLGLVMGRFLAHAALRLTSATVAALYISAAATPPALSLSDILLAFAISIPLALIAAALPAAEAARAQPADAVRNEVPEGMSGRVRGRQLAFAFSLLAVAGLMTRLKPVHGLPLFGYTSAVAIVFATSFLVPSVLCLLGRIGKRPLTWLFRVEGLLANANLSGSIARIAVSVSALAVSLAMMVAIAVMIGSFRATVVDWVGQILKADLYLRPATRADLAADANISAEVVTRAEDLPDVLAVDPLRRGDVPFEGGLVALGAGDFSVLLDHGNLVFKAPRNARAAMRRAIGRDEVAVTESFALKHGAQVGDAIFLPTPSGPAPFHIVAIYYDYSNDRGLVVMDWSTFTRHFGKLPPTSLAIYLRPGVAAETAREEVLAALGGRYRVLIYTNSSLRAEILRIFDGTFAVTYALEAIAIAIAILGVASTLLTLILERRRELSVLRLIGACRRQVLKMVVIEAGLIGLVSQGVGIAIGMLLALVLIYVINVQSFGWTIHFHLPAAFLLRSSALIVLATALSGLYPAHRASMLKTLVQVREE